MLLSVTLNIIVLHVQRKFLSQKHYAQLILDKFLPFPAPYPAQTNYLYSRLTRQRFNVFGTMHAAKTSSQWPLIC